MQKRFLFRHSDSNAYKVPLLTNYAIFFIRLYQFIYVLLIEVLNYHNKMFIMISVSIFFNNWIKFQ